MPASGTCPRCGFPAADGPFCPRCGRYLAPLVWVATPPPLPQSPVPAPRLPYAGPPRYRFLPRWGFLPRPWEPPAADVPPAADPLLVARSVAGTLVPLLWAAASVSAVACGAEIWRYLLLLASRADALDARSVRVSDALVVAAGTVAPVLAAVAGVLLMMWSVRAAQAAVAYARARPVRSARGIVLGWLVPVVNLVVPGSVLAEIEHGALGRPPGERPRPARLVLVWWGLWIADVLLAGVVLLWALRTGVQARADGVVLHAALDLLAAATAGVTAVLVTRLTRLLAPPRPVRREVLVAVAP